MAAKSSPRLDQLAGRTLRWQKALAIHEELLRLYRLREAGKPSHCEALIAKALRSGHEGIASTALIILGSLYQDAGDHNRVKAVEARRLALEPITRPRMIAFLDLHRRLGVESEVATDKQRVQIRGTLAYAILLAIYARLARIRIRELQAANQLAVSEGKHLEAVICDLFLISECRKAGDRKGEKAAVADLLRLERDFGVRDFNGDPYSESAKVRAGR